MALQPGFLGALPDILNPTVTQQFFPQTPADIQTQAMMQEKAKEDAVLAQQQAAERAAQQIQAQQQAAQEQQRAEFQQGVRQGIAQRLAPLLGNTQPEAQEAQALIPILAQNYQPMNYADRALANSIVGQKQAYEAARQKGDAAGMARAAQNAQYLRQFAEGQGADMRSFGADQTLQTGLLSLQADANAGLRQLLGSYKPDTDTYYSTYRKALDQGLRDKVADELAREAVANQKANRMQDLQQAFLNYGTNPDGSINDVGMFINQQIANMNPAGMAVADNGYAKPKDMYELAAQLTKMGMTDFYNAQGQERAFGYNQRGADAQQARAKDMATFNANLTMEQKTALANLELQTQGLALQQKQDIYYNWFKQAGLDDNSAALMAIQYASGGGRGNGSGNSGAGTQGQGMYSKDQITAADKAIERYDNYIAAGGDPDKYDAMDDYKVARQIKSNILTGGQGAQANAEIPIADPTGDWNTDKATIDQMTSIMRAYGTSDDEIAKAVYLHFSKELGEDYGKKALNYWKNGEKQEKPKDTPAARAARGDGSKASNTPARRVVVDVQGGNAEDIADDNAGTGNGIIPIFGRGLKRIGEVTGLAPNPNKLLNGR